MIEPLVTSGLLRVPIDINRRLEHKLSNRYFVRLPTQEAPLLPNFSYRT